MISQRFDFWNSKTKTNPWPREGRWEGRLDLVFIPRAFNMIGASLFKDKWSSGGVEGYAELEPPLPEDQSTATFAQLDLAERALNNHASYKGRRPLPPPPSIRVGGLGGLGGAEIGAPVPPPEMPPRFFDDDWTEAARIVAGWMAVRNTAIERRKAVVEWLIARVADDKTLRVVLRHIQSGEQFLGPAEHWNGHWHQLEGRWRRGSYYLQAPFAQPGISELGWEEVAIFVVEEDLRALLDTAQKRGEATGTGGSDIPEQNIASTAADLGLAAPIVHEDRTAQGAEADAEYDTISVNPVQSGNRDDQLRGSEAAGRRAWQEELEARIAGRAAWQTAKKDEAHFTSQYHLERVTFRKLRAGARVVGRPKK